MPTPNDVKARVASAYRSAADHYDHPANTFWNRFGQRTVERAEIRSGQRVLDVCCGSGASAIPAAEATGPAGIVVAVDLAEDLIELGRRKAARLGLRNVEFRVADMLDLDLEPASFDHVVCVFGIFFVPDMTASLREMGRFLKPGGRLAVTTWGRGLFEPVNSMFWAAIRRVRPELDKAFNPWDRIGEPQQVLQQFALAGLPAPLVELERGQHPLRNDDDVIALLLGTGYRGTIEQLGEEERTQVCTEVLEQKRSQHVTEVEADVIYAGTPRDQNQRP